MPLSDNRRVTEAALSEIETALKGYYTAVKASDLALSSQIEYIDKANNFVRWLRGEFVPGSRVAPYRVVIDRPKTPTLRTSGPDPK